jgi:protein-S-isoprenylcysteine O-methyltransferase Ste14
MISGIILIIGAFFSFDVLEFFGIRQIISKRKESKISISRHGFYGVIRHPMYLGGFIFFIALMTNAPLGQFLGYLILAIYMIIGTIREDRRLTNELGEIYRSYQKEVPMFLPRFLWRKKDKC